MHPFTGVRGLEVTGNRISESGKQELMKKNWIIGALISGALLLGTVPKVSAASDAEAAIIRILTDIAQQGATAGPLPSGASTAALQTDGTQKVQVTRQIGAANYANGQVATSTTAGTLVAARATRRSVTIKNVDASITVYIGAATVTAANGMEIKAGQSINIDTTALIQVIAASGTPAVAYIETYD